MLNIENKRWSPGKYLFCITIWKWRWHMKFQLWWSVSWPSWRKYYIHSANQCRDYFIRRLYAIHLANFELRINADGRERIFWKIDRYSILFRFWNWCNHMCYNSEWCSSSTSNRSNSTIIGLSTNENAFLNCSRHRFCHRFLSSIMIKREAMCFFVERSLNNSDKLLNIKKTKESTIDLVEYPDDKEKTNRQEEDKTNH